MLGASNSRTHKRSMTGEENVASKKRDILLVDGNPARVLRFVLQLQGSPDKSAGSSDWTKEHRRVRRRGVRLRKLSMATAEMLAELHRYPGGTHVDHTCSPPDRIAARCSCTPPKRILAFRIACAGCPRHPRPPWCRCHTSIRISCRNPRSRGWHTRSNPTAARDR